jgi:hypothetical protein
MQSDDSISPKDLESQAGRESGVKTKSRFVDSGPYPSLVTDSAGNTPFCCRNSRIA